MKNITLSADDHLIEAAYQRAAEEHTTLNEQFRLWLKHYVQDDRRQGTKRDRQRRKEHWRIFFKDISASCTAANTYPAVLVCR